MPDRFENSAETILALAQAFDAVRAKMRELLPPGEGLNLTLSAIGLAQQRAWRAYHSGSTE